MPRGGARPGAGRKRAPAIIDVVAESALAKVRAAKPRQKARTSRKPSEPVEIDGEEVVVVEQAKQEATGNRRKGADILSNLANFAYAMATRFRPVAGNLDANENKFLMWAKVATENASKVAPYESATFLGVRMEAPPVDLSQLSAEDIDELERLYAKASAEPRRDPGREGKTIN